MNYFSCLLIGNWGTGKTTAAATAPGPVLFIDVDNKLEKMENLKEKRDSGEVLSWHTDKPLTQRSLRELASAKFKQGGKTVQPIPKGYQEIADFITKLEETGCVYGGKKIETVVLDSYTTLTEHIKRLMMAVNSTQTMTMPLYGLLLQNYETINNTLLRLPANVIVVCHEKLNKDELNGSISYQPLIEGQMANKIGVYFEEVYYMKKSTTGGDAKYEMLTVGDSMRSCRTSRKLDAKVEPDFSKIYK